MLSRPRRNKATGHRTGTHHIKAIAAPTDADSMPSCVQCGMPKLGGVGQYKRMIRGGVDGKTVLTLTQSKEPLYTGAPLNIAGDMTAPIVMYKKPPDYSGPGPPLNICCTLTSRLMSDPVLASDGYFYELSSLQNYVDQANIARPNKTTLSPKTGNPLAMVVGRSRLVRRMAAEWVHNVGNTYTKIKWEVYDKHSVALAFNEFGRHISLVFDTLGHYIQRGDPGVVGDRASELEAMHVLEKLEMLDMGVQRYARRDIATIMPLRKAYARMHGLRNTNASWENLPPLGSMDTPRVQEDYYAMLYVMYAYALHTWAPEDTAYLRRLRLELPPRALPHFIETEVKKHEIDVLESILYKH